MRRPLSLLAVLALLCTAAACELALPPPPVLTVTSPERGLVQGSPGRITVTGRAVPGAGGEAVTRVSVNGTPAQLAADGSFTAEVDLPHGAMLLETTATNEGGSSATDARAVQVGELRPVGTTVERAITAALSADALARLGEAAGPILASLDYDALLAPLQPMARLGDQFANLDLSIDRLTLANATITMTPVDGGLAFSATLDGLDLAATADVGGALVPDSSTSVRITADQVTIAGTLVVTPSGTAGFTTKITSPQFRATRLELDASGLAGSILDVLQDGLDSAVQKIVTTSAERGLDPMFNAAFGALAGPQELAVMGTAVRVEASPSAVAFSPAGALVTMNVQLAIGGAEASPGYVYTPNGTPAMEVGRGIQLGMADDLMNEILAQVHALGLLDIHLEEDFGLFDTVDFSLTLPPMVSANNEDGTMRLVLGDMVATFADDGDTVLSAAVNAQIDLAIDRGDASDELALRFGQVHAYVNVFGEEPSSAELAAAAASGIGVQLDSLGQFLVTLPAPAVAGVTFDSLSMHADRGYVMVSGEIH